MNLLLEFVPDWAASDEWPARQTSFLSKSIETTLDVNNYYQAQLDFFMELMMYDNGDVCIKPLYTMGATCVADHWKLLMSQGDLVDPTATFDPKTAHGRTVIQKAFNLLESSDACNGAYGMTTDAASYTHQSAALKQYVRFAASEDEKTVFINMTNEPAGDSAWCLLDTKDHASLRASFFEALYNFLRTVVTVNGMKGDAKYLISRYPALAYCYNYYLSYGS